MTTLTITWTASTALIRQEAQETGKTGQMNRQTIIDMSSMTPEERAAALPVAEAISLSGVPEFVIDINTTVSLKKDSPSFRPEDANQWISTNSLYCDTPPSLEDAIRIASSNAATRKLAGERAAASALEQKLAKERVEAAYQAQFNSLRAVYLELEPQVRALVSSDDLEALEEWTWPQGYRSDFPHFDPFNTYPYSEFSRLPSLGKLIEERKYEIKKERQKAAKASWVEQHGSDHLKRACAAGHNCDRLYWIERAAVEYPGYTLDYEDHANWKDRSCPTIAMLDRRDEILAAHPGVQATIVWLTDAPRDRKRSDYYDDYDDYEPFDAREGLVVNDPIYTKYLVL